MTKSRVLLLFTLLAFRLPPQGKSFLAQAASARDKEHHVSQQAEASEREGDQPWAGAASAPAPVDVLPFNATVHGKSTDLKSPVGISQERRSVTSSFTGTFRTLSLLSLICAAILVLGVLMVGKPKPPVELPKGTPPELALELKMAVELLPDAKNLADAVATIEATKAYNDAAECISEAQKASHVADVEVGMVREKAIRNLKRRLEKATDALRALHFETQLAGTELLDQFPAFEAVIPWCEAVGKFAADSDELRPIGNVLVSFESSAGYALLQAKLAWSQLYKGFFGSLKDGDILRDGFMDIAALQVATSKVLQLSEFSKNVQEATLKAIRSSEALKHLAIAELLWEELTDATHSCVQFFEKEKSLSSASKDQSQLESWSMDATAAVQLAKDGAGSLLGAHSRAISRIEACEDPNEFRKLMEELKTLERKVEALVETLWESVKQCKAFRTNRKFQQQYEQRRLMRAAQNAKVQGENYKQFAMQRIDEAHEAINDILVEDLAGDVAPDSGLAPNVKRLKETLVSLGFMLMSKIDKLDYTFQTAGKWGELAKNSASKNDRILDVLRARSAEVAAEAREVVAICDEVFHVHAEASFTAILQAYIRAITREFEVLSSAIPEGSGGAAQQARQLVEQFEEARLAVDRAANLQDFADHSVVMGLAVSKLAYLAYKHNRGLSDGD